MLPIILIPLCLGIHPALNPMDTKERSSTEQHGTDIQTTGDGGLTCACDSVFSYGDQVVLLVDNLSNTELNAGATGTVVCVQDLAPFGEFVLVIWNYWHVGFEGPTSCECGIANHEGNSNFWVSCTDVELYTPQPGPCCIEDQCEIVTENNCFAAGGIFDYETNECLSENCSISQFYENPIDYGAIPNDGIDDQFAIQAAVDEASLHDGTVYIPEGTFDLLSPIVIKPYVTIRGVGDSSVLHTLNDSSGILYDYAEVNRIIVNTNIRDLHIKGSGIPSDSFVSLIAMVQGVDGAILENLLLTNSGYDGWHALQNCQNVVIRNCRIQDCLDDGINPGGHANGGTNSILIENNFIQNIAHDGIHVSWGSYNITARNNTIENCNNGILLWQSECSIIRHNTISGSANHAIHDLQGYHHIAANITEGEVVGNTPGDVTCDNVIDLSDLLSIISNWGDCDCREDLTGDMVVDVSDLLLFFDSW